MSFQDFIAMMEDYPQTDATLTNTSLDEDASIIYGTYEIYSKESGAFKPYNLLEYPPIFLFF